MTGSPHDCEALLAHAGWVRALARQLTADPHAADDLAQDALTAALVRPPPADRPLRSWLAGVLRNLAREKRRSTAHRVARERAVARAEGELSSAGLLERLDAHRALVEATARLDEPYRSALLMRYFEGLSPGEIARRTATPTRTVHTRLQRALARLRAELDRAHGGDRRSWLLALLPHARGAGGGTLSALGMLVMDAKLKLALVLVLVAGVGSTLALWPDDPPGEPSATLAEVRGGADPPAEPRSRDARELAPSVVDERQPLEAARVVSAPTPPPEAPARWRGRVIDVERAPVAGVRVRVADKGGTREAETDLQGQFELDSPAAGVLDVVSPGWTALLCPELTDTSTGSRSEPVLVVARSLQLAGLVVDEGGRPVAGAELSAPLPLGLRARFDVVLDRARSVERSAHTDGAGRFELPDVPLVPGVELVTAHAAFLTDRRALPGHDEFALRIVLGSARAAPGVLAGVVLDPTGAPVEGAWVALGSASTRSGAEGRFTLELDAEARAESGPLRAVKPGYLPAERTPTADGSFGAWPVPLELRLGDAPLAIAGRVLDAGGAPVAGAAVWTGDETHFGYVAIERGEMAMRAGASIEGLLRDDPWEEMRRTDAGGRFELAGLLPHAYRVHAFDRRSLSLVSAELEAGARGVELVLPDEARHARIAGRLTDLAGVPLAGAEVVLARRRPGPRPDLLETAPVVTDGEGRFRFADVSSALEELGVRGPELGPAGFRRALGPGDDLEHLELAVALDVHVQIEAEGAADFERVAVLDGAGARLALTVQHGPSSYAMEELDLYQGRSEPFSVSQAARVLVLLRAGAEVRRVPLALERGRLNSVRP